MPGGKRLDPAGSIDRDRAQEFSQLTQCIPLELPQLWPLV